MSEDSPIQPENDDESDSLSLSQMFGSALAAALGIQSKANRERDFARGKPFHFVIVGFNGLLRWHFSRRGTRVVVALR